MSDKKTYILTCKRCSNEYESGSARQGYCAECKRIRANERARESRERKARGESRSIGSADICEKCGQPYIIKTGSQKLCENCIEKGVIIRRTKQNNSKYRAEKYDEVHIFLPKGEREQLKIFASFLDKSMNEFIIEAITKYRAEMEEEVAKQFESSEPKTMFGDDEMPF